MSQCVLIAYHRGRLLELRHVERFVGPDPTAAEDAFLRISAHVRLFLRKYLAGLLPNEEDRAETISVVLERLWSARTRTDVRGLGAWWAYVAVIARRCALDRLGKIEEREWSQEIPVDDLDLIGVVAEACAHRDLMYRAADECWLGVEPDIETFQRKRRLLAAQLHYLHMRPWDEILEIVSGREVVTRDLLDEWLVNSAAIRELAYCALFLATDDLAGYVLRPEKPLSGAEVSEWYRAATERALEPPEGWQWDEILVSILKYRNGLHESKISQSTGLTLDGVNSALDRARSRLPFVSTAKRLEYGLRSGRAPIQPLQAAGTWKRLVFQYSVASELPQRHILELMGPPAESGGFTLTAGMLNVWLSNGRLAAQLAAYIQKRGTEIGR